LNSGMLTINKSTISGNSAGDYWGGGIYNETSLTVNNSTISGNGLAYYGGGIFNWSTLAISNSTVSGNTATIGGGIFNIDGQIVLQNTIVASSPRGGNCSGTITSLGYNLSSDNTCNFNGPGDMKNTETKLGKLNNNGGPTQTIRLLKGSPAIDAGNPNGCTDSNGKLLKTDQRGAPRPDKEDKTGCNMGAYERQSD